MERVTKEEMDYLLSRINFGASALDAKAIDAMNRLDTLFEEYTIQTFVPRDEPSTQTPSPRPTMVLATHNPTGLSVAVDYMGTAYKNKEEAVRILKDKVSEKSKKGGER